MSDSLTENFIPVSAAAFAHQISEATDMQAVRALTYQHYVASIDKPERIFHGRDKEEVCDALTTKAICQMEKASFFDLPGVLQLLNKTRTAMGCGSLSEVSHLPKAKTSQARLHDYLVKRVATEIQTAPSGCVANANIKSLNSGMDMIGSKLSEDEKKSLSDVLHVLAFPEWLEPNKRALGLKAHEVTSAPAFAA